MASNFEVDTKETTTSPEYSVLVVGFTGVGKSAFCNFLAGEKLFNEFEGIFGESSNEINKQQCEVLRTKLTIIDCPGFGDTEKTIDEYSTELETYLREHGISIDIIILVINLTERFSKEESELFLNMSKTMGYFWEKTFCVFTHAASLEKKFRAKQTDSSSETKFDYIELIKNSPKTSQELKELLKIVQDRYLCIETVDMAGDKEYWTANVDKLLKSFKEIKKNWVEKGKKMERMERKEEILKKTEQMEPEEEIVKKTESKEEMDPIKRSTEEPKPENHHEKENETIIKNQNKLIALISDQNASLIEREKSHQDQLLQVDKKLNEIKEDQNRRCHHL